MTLREYPYREPLVEARLTIQTDRADVIKTWDVAVVRDHSPYSVDVPIVEFYTAEGRYVTAMFADALIDHQTDEDLHLGLDFKERIPAGAAQECFIAEIKALTASFMPDPRPEPPDTLAELIELSSVSREEIHRETRGMEPR